MANFFTSALAKDVGTSPVLLYAPPGGMKSIVIELDVANTTNGAIMATVFIRRGGIDYHVIKGAPVPNGSALQVISGQKIVLADGDAIYALASAAASLDVVTSVLEDV